MTAPPELWLLVLAGIGATYLWRALGVLLSARIDPEGPTFRWVTCVSYAMLAALIARMILQPLGALADTVLIDRLIALACALVIFFLTGRSILTGVLAGVGVFIAAIALRGGAGL